MANDRSSRLGVVRRNTLAACLAAALTAGAADTQSADAQRTHARFDQVFSGIHTPWMSRTNGWARRKASHPASPASPAINYLPVENCADDGSDGSLRQVFAIAQDDDVIDLRGLATVCSTITLASGAISVEASGLTVLGPGQDKLTIEADTLNPSRVFQSKYYGLAISDVTIANGVATSGFGGCIDITGGQGLTLTRSTVTGCHAGDGSNAESRGGAVYVDGDLTMYESTISASSAVASDSANGGGAYVGGDALFIGSTLSGNTASSTCNSCYNRNMGGGIYATGWINASYTTIRDNTVLSISSDGEARGGGLATYDLGDFGRIVLKNSTVSGNRAMGENGYGIGGGIWVKDETSFYVANSTIAFNEASDFGGGAVGGLGGGSPVFILESSIVANNQAPEGADLGTGDLLMIEGNHNLVLVAGPGVTFNDSEPLHDDPLLLSLDDYGGLTATHALAANSSAIDNGYLVGKLQSIWDQRGCPYARASGLAPDIGAFELQVGTIDYIFGDGFDGELLCP